MNKRIKKKHDVIPHNISINRFRKILIKLAGLSEKEARMQNIIFNELDRHKEQEYEDDNN